MISVSFHNGNVSGDLVRAQKAVFDHFDIEHLQIHTDLPHGQAIDHYLNTRFWDTIAIFDIDCIPLNDDIMGWAEAIVSEGKTLFGIAQAANHLGSALYVGAPFVCFSKRLYEDIGSPSFAETKTEDVGGEVTRAAIRAGKQIHMMEPTHVEDPKWNLYGNIMFGYGTTYQDHIYHAFESRYQHESTSRFIQKCKQVINGN